MRILVADRHPGVRSAPRLILEQEPGVKAVGDAGAADEASARLRATQADLLLLDWSLAARAPSEMLAGLRAILPSPVGVALSGRPDLCSDALSAGAGAFASKIDPPESLLRVLWSACTCHLDAD